jgi:hypothetical protein
MHAVKQITPQVLIIMAVGIIAFLVIMRLIFRKK